MVIFVRQVYHSTSMLISLYLYLNDVQIHFSLNLPDRIAISHGQGKHSLRHYGPH